MDMSIEEHQTPPPAEGGGSMLLDLSCIIDAIGAPGKRKADEDEEMRKELEETSGLGPLSGPPPPNPDTAMGKMRSAVAAATEENVGSPLDFLEKARSNPDEDHKKAIAMLPSVDSQGAAGNLGAGQGSGEADAAKRHVDVEMAELRQMQELEQQNVADAARRYAARPGDLLISAGCVASEMLERQELVDRSMVGASLDDSLAVVYPGSVHQMVMCPEMVVFNGPYYHAFTYGDPSRNLEKGEIIQRTGNEHLIYGGPDDALMEDDDDSPFEKAAEEDPGAPGDDPAPGDEDIVDDEDSDDLDEGESEPEITAEQEAAFQLTEFNTDPELGRLKSAVDRVIEEFDKSCRGDEPRPPSEKPFLPPASSFAMFVQMDERIETYLQFRGIECHSSMEQDLPKMPKGIIPKDLEGWEEVERFEKTSRIFFGLVTKYKTLSGTLDGEDEATDEELTRRESCMKAVNELIKTVGAALQALRKSVRLTVAGMTDVDAKRRIKRHDFWKLYFSDKALNSADERKIDKALRDVADTARASAVARINWEAAKRDSFTAQDFRADDFVYQEPARGDNLTEQMNLLAERYNSPSPSRPLSNNEKADLYIRWTNLRIQRDEMMGERQSYFLTGMQRRLQDRRNVIKELNKRRRDVKGQVASKKTQLLAARAEWVEAGGLPAYKRADHTRNMLREASVVPGLDETQVKNAETRAAESAAEFRRLQDLLRNVRDAEVSLDIYSRTLGEIEMNKTFAESNISVLRYQIAICQNAPRQRKDGDRLKQKQRRAAYKLDGEEADAEVEALLLQEEDALAQLRAGMPKGAHLGVELKKRELARIRRRRLVEKAERVLTRHKVADEKFESMKEEGRTERREARLWLLGEYKSKMKEAEKDLERAEAGLEVARQVESSRMAGGSPPGLEGADGVFAHRFNYQAAVQHVQLRQQHRLEEIAQLELPVTGEYLKQQPAYARVAKQLESHLASQKDPGGFFDSNDLLNEIAGVEKADREINRLLVRTKEAEASLEGTDSMPERRVGEKSAPTPALEHLKVELGEWKAYRASILKSIGALRSTDLEEMGRRARGVVANHREKLAELRAAEAEAKERVVAERAQRAALISGEHARNCVYEAVYQELADATHADQQAVDVGPQKLFHAERDRLDREIADLDAYYKENLLGLGCDPSKGSGEKFEWRAWPFYGPVREWFAKANADRFKVLAARTEVDNKRKNLLENLYARVTEVYANSCDLEQAGGLAGRVDAFYRDVVEVSKKYRTLGEKLASVEDSRRKGMDYARSEKLGTNGWVARYLAMQRADREAQYKERSTLGKAAIETAESSLATRLVSQMQLMVNEIGALARKGSGRAMHYCGLLLRKLGFDTEACKKGGLNSVVNMAEIVSAYDKAGSRPTLVDVERLLEKWQKMPIQLRGCEMPPEYFKRDIANPERSRLLKLIHLDAAGKPLRVDEETGEVVATSMDDADLLRGLRPAHLQHRRQVPAATPVAFVRSMGRVVPVTDDLRLPRLSAPDQRNLGYEHAVSEHLRGAERAMLFVFHKTRNQLFRDYKARLIHWKNGPLRESAASFSARADVALRTAVRWNQVFADDGSVLEVPVDPSQRKELLSPAIKAGLANHQAAVVAVNASMAALYREQEQVRASGDTIFSRVTDSSVYEVASVDINGITIEVPNLKFAGKLGGVADRVYKRLLLIEQNIAAEHAELNRLGADWVGRDSAQARTDASVGASVVQVIESESDADGFLYLEDAALVHDERSPFSGWPDSERKKALKRARLFVQRWYPWVNKYRFPENTEDEGEWSRFGEFVAWNSAMRLHGCVCMAMCDQFNGLMNLSSLPLRFGSGVEGEIPEPGFMQRRLRGQPVMFVDLRASHAISTRMPLNTTYAVVSADNLRRHPAAVLAAPYTAIPEHDFQEAPLPFAGEYDSIDIKQLANDGGVQALLADAHAKQADADYALRLAEDEKIRERKIMANLKAARDDAMDGLVERVHRDDLVPIPTQDQIEREVNARVGVEMNRLKENLPQETEASGEEAREMRNEMLFRESNLAPTQGGGFFSVAVDEQTAAGVITTNHNFTLYEPFEDENLLWAVVRKLRDSQKYGNQRLGIGTVVKDGEKKKAIVRLDGDRSSLSNGRIVEPLFNWIGGSTEMIAFREMVIAAWKREAVDVEEIEGTVPPEKRDEVIKELEKVYEMQDRLQGRGIDDPVARPSYSAPALDARRVSLVGLAAALAAYDPGPIRSPLLADGTVVRPLPLAPLC